MNLRIFTLLLMPFMVPLIGMESPNTTTSLHAEQAKYPAKQPVSVENLDFTGIPTAGQDWKSAVWPSTKTLDALSTALLTYFGYQRYGPPSAPVNLTAFMLNSQLTRALNNKEYGYAYQLARQNPQAVHQLAADIATKESLVTLIFKEATDLALEKKPSWQTQLQYLANLRDAINEQETVVIS